METVRVITQPESWAQEVRSDVVRALEELLERAKSGEIQGLAYACATIDNCVSTGFTKSNAHSAILGGLERVKFRMLSGED